MGSLWQMAQRLLLAGSQCELDTREQRRIVVNNAIALMLATNTLLYVVVLYALGLHALALWLIPVVLGYLLTIGLNQAGHLTTSRVVLMWLGNVTVFVYLVAIGIRDEVSLFFVAACLPMIVCGPKDKIAMWSGVGLSVACGLSIALGADALMGEHLLSVEGEFHLRAIVTSGTFILLLAIVRSFDVSNARAEQELRHAHHNIKRLLDRVDQGFVTLDASGCIGAERSATFDQWFGTPTEGTPFHQCLASLDPVIGAEFKRAWPAINGAVDSAVDNTDAASLDRLAASFPAHVENGGRDYRLDYRRDTTDQSSLAGLLVVTSDVTADRERARAETRERALLTELAQAQKLESVGRLAAGVAHEINTPIQYIGDNVAFVRSAVNDLRELVGAYQTLRRAVENGSAAPSDAQQVLAAEQKADLEYMMDNLTPSLDQATEGVQRVAAIVQSMKDFAHPDSDAKSPADINRALKSTITVATSSFKSAAELETNFGQLPEVYCYLGSLNQVFLNLIVNAADAIEERVGGTDERGRIDVKTEADEHSVLISIADNGAGIPEAAKAQIFDQFFTTKAVGKGTGQGLAIAQRIVSNHGGTIWFESTVGVGTTFFIRLPIRLTVADPVLVAA